MGSEMCIRDRRRAVVAKTSTLTLIIVQYVLLARPLDSPLSKISSVAVGRKLTPLCKLAAAARSFMLELRGRRCTTAVARATLRGEAAWTLFSASAVDSHRVYMEKCYPRTTSNFSLLGTGVLYALFASCTRRVMR